MTVDQLKIDRQEKIMGFTERQSELIAFCKTHGYGWRKFAESVEKSGRCTQRQEDVLCTMKQKIQAAKNNKTRGYGKNSINDCEIMSFGLYL